MKEQKIGTFIQQLRKENNLTQKELGEQLNITDKAISKWERGLSCPDISLVILSMICFAVDSSVAKK